MISHQLDKRVTIQTPTSVQDENGEIVPGWANVATVWANIVDLSGKEFLTAAATQNTAQTKITIRNMAGIVPAMRVLHGSVIYSINAALEQNSRTMLLMCTKSL